MKPKVFISHASEDKKTVARPLAKALRSRGVSVWFDEYSLNLGDSLRASIDEGLANAQFGIVILSPTFFSRKWPREELDGLTAREIVLRRKAIFPVWHRVGLDEIAKESPTLAAKLGISTEAGIPNVVSAILRAIEAEETKLNLQSLDLHSQCGGELHIWARPNASSYHDEAGHKHFLSDSDLKHLLSAAQSLFEQAIETPKRKSK